MMFRGPDTLIKEIKEWTYEDCALELAGMLNELIHLTQCDPMIARMMRLSEKWVERDDDREWLKRADFGEAFACDTSGQVVFLIGGTFIVEDITDV